MPPSITGKTNSRILFNWRPCLVTFYSNVWNTRSACHLSTHIRRFLGLFCGAQCYLFSSQVLNYQSLPGRIRTHYILGGLPNPLVTGNGQTHLRLNHVLRGIHRLQGSSTRPRLPITFDILKGLCELLRKGVFGPYFDLMLEAAFLLAFFGFLRCSEFACTTNSFNPNLNLCVRDVKVVTRGEHIDHLSINIKTSKTDQFRRGFDLRLFPTNTSLCPVSTLYRFLTVRREMNAAQSEPLFLLPERIPLNRRVFTTSLRSLLTRLRLEPQYFAGHSFRIGAATTAASVHLPDHLIQTLGRWSSDCYRIYIRTPEKLLRYAFTALTQ
uniref:Uncharacterized protein LOC102807917 n=1 Tax=Saccoglossus kowalevskii TaxID=10224 RepID=A0ABM0MQP0_SACKO